ncbi:hypothetical protein QBC34DRAFT_498684 [Podospora aff. communis PSN243]|uniref:Nephrocystin 3-like N-terminal domain-containing protein n=1 Tax=Podospora aff. communis PSN243 TaxID=3040156 RepID=A0AAV9GA32_9PEZI|nr:hypothetical protein QBC34DRAFT_498684 [Podospora aff. communis PSN243]
MGIVATVRAVEKMGHAFPNIKHWLVVGIAGGVPSHGVDRDQIVLGDVVVGTRGVAHFECGAWTAMDNLEHRPNTLNPSEPLLVAANRVKAMSPQKMGGSNIPQYLEDLRKLTREGRDDFEDPVCDKTSSKQRKDRGKNAYREKDCPVIHHGIIGSSEALVISSQKRNDLYRKHWIIAFEMEAAGAGAGALVVRGICDYADSHKNKRWQRYAAATAAAHAKEILLELPAAQEVETGSAADDELVQEHNGVLWVKGNPGTGKSTLMKHTLEECRKTFENHTIIAHFFNARGDPLEKTQLGLLRSLVWQLVDKEPVRKSVLLSRYKEKKQKQGEVKWRESELREFLASEVRRSRQKPLALLIDALDECDEDHVREVVTFLETLVVEAKEAKTKLSICLASRTYPNISMTRFSSGELKLDAADGHLNDILEYVGAYLNKELRENDPLIVSTVQRKASGVFMWAVLVVAILNEIIDEGRAEDVQKKLREVPKELDRLYSSILEQGGDSTNTAETPLRLSEVFWALLTGVSGEPEKLLQSPYFSKKADKSHMQRRITSASRGLVEVRVHQQWHGENSDTVQFIHESVNNFFTENNRYNRLCKLDPSLGLNPIGDSYNRLKLCCLAYILAVPLQHFRYYSDKEGSHLEVYPFLAHSIIHFLVYASKAEENGVGQLAFIQGLRKNSSKSNEVCLRLSSELLVSDALRANSAETVIARRWAEGQARRWRRRISIVRQPSSAIEGPGLVLEGEYCQYKSTLLLGESVFFGLKALVEWLLEDGVDVNAHSLLYPTALYMASAAGDEELVKTILTHGADPGDALVIAAQEERETIFNMLFGAEKNLGGKRTAKRVKALVAAAQFGKPGMVRMLLDTGIDVNARARKMTALEAAVSPGSKDVVEMLLAAGAHPNMEDKDGRCLVFTDVAAGYREIVKMLLEAKAEADGRALPFAAGKGDVEMVKMLLDHGADIDMRGVDNRTALGTALRAADRKLVKLLLSSGAKVEEEYENVLDAARYGCWQLVDLVLSHKEHEGPGAREDCYQALMRMGTEMGNCRVVKTLERFRAKAPWGEGKKAAGRWEYKWTRAKPGNYKLYRGSSDESEEDACGDGAEDEAEDEVADADVGDEGETDQDEQEVPGLNIKTWAFWNMKQLGLPLT